MLNDAFQKLGRLVNIYIPGRKDKGGSYFSFIKYEGVKYVQVLLNSLNRVRCGHCITKVNLAIISQSRLDWEVKTSTQNLFHWLTLILKLSYEDFGHSPFRFFNSWLMRDDLNEIFYNASESFHGFGAPDSYLAAKSKFVKNTIRESRQKELIKEQAELI